MFLLRYANCGAKIAIFYVILQPMSEKVNAIFEGLNEEQKSAVSCVEGPVLIVAGAGSGKTRVLTSRIAYLLSLGHNPSGILALTFTKKAAGEMKERIAAMVGAPAARRLVMGTFHAVFVRFLREFADRIGYPERFTIYDTSDSTSAIKACIKELGLDEKIYKPKEVLSRISSAKNNLITASGYRKKPELINQDINARKGRICDLYQLYQEKMKQAGVMDFDDILLETNILFRDHPDALETVAGRFSHIMVDEYQDTNASQYLILKKLAQFHRNICVVGDDSQSIYAFRGAKIENILNFKNDYPESKLVRLERNYRSTSTIVNAANSLIAHNDGRIPKNCYAVGPEGEKIKILKSYNEQEEGISIVARIMAKMREHHSQYQDFAILYRTNSQSRALEEQLRRRNIPYMIYSGNSFFDRMEVKDMMSYFKLCVNNGDDEAFKRVVNKPARGIGNTTMAKIAEDALARNITLFEAAKGVEKVKPFCDMITRLSALVPTTDALVLAQKIADESGLYNFFKSDNSIEGQSRATNVEELINSVASFIEERESEAIQFEEDEGMEHGEHLFTLDDYLENVSLLSNVDVSSDEDTNNKVALTTVHSAKGLEFPYVFVAGMEENLFPSQSMTASRNDIEEERRLFYVAVTRAERQVFLSFADSRMRNGKHESNTPSRFIREIDTRYIENPLHEEDFEASKGFEISRGFGFGSGLGSERSPRRFASNRHSDSSYGDYGRSSKVSYEKRSIPGIPTSSSLNGRPVRTQAPRPADPDFKPVDMRELNVGERVEHNHFGRGTILTLSGNAPEMKAQIRFDDSGEKVLLLKYAKLRKI